MKIDIAGVGTVTLLHYAHTRAEVSDGTDGPRTATEAVVLVNRGTTYEPFVTWKIFIAEDGARPEAFWGHYHSDYDKAVQDFKERAGLTSNRLVG